MGRLADDGVQFEEQFYHDNEKFHSQPGHHSIYVDINETTLMGFYLDVKWIKCVDTYVY